MKTIYAAILLAAAVSLAGCKGFWDPLPSSSTTTTPTKLSSGPFYVLSEKTSQIAGYDISSGSLQKLSNSPYTPLAGATLYSIGIAPGGNFLYVSSNSGIFVYSIATGGALTYVNTIAAGDAVSSDEPYAVQVSQNSAWLIDAFPVPGGTQVQVNAIPLDSNGLAGGAQVSTTITASSPTVKQMVLSPKEDYLFLALGTGGAVAIPFTASSSTPFGTSQPVVSPSNTAQGVLSVAVDPSERIFYVGETSVFTTGTTGGLLAFDYTSLGSATLTQISGSPIASGGTSPSAILAEASGDFVYVANGNGEASAGNITWFPITPSSTSYSIAAGKNVASGYFPVSLAEDNSSNFILAASQFGNPDLEAFTMSSGALTATITTSTGSNSVNTAFAVAAQP